MPRLLPLVALLPLLTALALAQPPMPKDPPKKLLTALALAQPPMPKDPPKKLTADERKELEAKLLTMYETGMKASRAGKLADAVTALEESLTLARLLYNRTDFPDGHANLATVMNNLGMLYPPLGKATDAERLYADVLAMRKRLHKDRDHPDVAQSLNNLGTLRGDLGKPAEGVQFLTDALAMLKRLYKGQDTPSVAVALNSLGVQYQALGRYADAERLFTDTLAMRQRLYKDQDHPSVATALNNLGHVNWVQRKSADAERLFKDALAMRRRLSKDQDHPSVAAALNSLAALYDTLGRSAEAEPLLKDALAMRKRLYNDQDHQDVATALNSLGVQYQALGRSADAERLLRDAVAMRQRLHEDRDHPDVALGLQNLGLFCHALGKWADAEPFLADALAMRKRLFAGMAAAQSELDQIGSRASLRHFLDTWLHVAISQRPAAEQYAEVLAWKGSAFARQAQLRAAILGANDPALAKLFAERSDVARRFANLTAGVPPPDRLAEHGKAVKALADRTVAIDRELARLSEPFRKARETAALTPDRLAKALPADAVLVDYLGYDHWMPDPKPDPDKKRRWISKRRFLAFVVRNGKPMVGVELGVAESIEEAVTAWRQAIERGAGNSGKDDPAAVLRRLVWEPVAKHLGDAKTVLISPDGALGRLPFAALPGSDPKKYLLEEVAIAVVPVPQLIPEMLSAKPDTAAKPSLLVVGGVDFDADAGVPAAGTESRAAVRGGSAGKWRALACTDDEAKAVTNAFAKQFTDGQTTSLTGTGATEAAIRDGITGRRVLHFATHGFFAPPPPEPKEPVGLRAEMFDRNRAVGVHPGLQCGLVLAGANKPPKAGADDGILTALEVAGLDLRGVELAVLSACETGLGKDAGGEGVLGLQRAFQAAGAGRVVSSLWKVPDQSTAALMGRFYQHLWADKQPAAEALRRAQLELLRNPDKVAGWAKAFRGATADDDKMEATDGRLPPRAWAAFQLSGDWR